MKFIIFFLFGLTACFSSIAQSQYLIRFTDKNATPYSISQPEKYLSERAIQRRAKQQIAIDSTDLPINPKYIDSVLSSGNVTLLTKSKWLNQISIRTNDAVALAKIATFSFVKTSSAIKRSAIPGMVTRNKFFDKFTEIQRPHGVSGVSDLSYGLSASQVKIHNGDYLHDKGFTGKGMLIAIIDDGFYHYKNFPAFQKVVTNNQVVETYDFVKLSHEVEDEDSHGMYCFSIIASNVPGTMVGTCPDANFLLYRSEDISSESPAEEQNWVAAAERSDSAGADIITTSLGYNVFDNPVFNHSYEDMDGQTTIIAIGANAAASKGMIVLAAAGNAGNTPWHYIVSPGDAKNILTIGAIDTSGKIGYFSSYGPTSDGRIKPTVVSVGVGTILQTTNGNFGAGDGTSFATPNLAGLVTCLWQAFPDFSSQQVMDAVIKSGSQYSSPDNALGYGIPNMKMAYDDLAQQRYLKKATELLQDKKFLIYPNPFSDHAQLLIDLKVKGKVVFQIFDMNGKLCREQSETVVTTGPQFIIIKKEALAKGMYILRFQNGDEIYSSKLLIR